MGTGRIRRAGCATRSRDSAERTGSGDGAGRASDTRFHRPRRSEDKVLMTAFTRRRALGSLGSLLAASPVLQGQELIGEPPGRITPRAELVNLFEVEAVAKRKLPGAV